MQYKGSGEEEKNIGEELGLWDIVSRSIVGSSGSSR